MAAMLKRSKASSLRLLPLDKPQSCEGARPLSPDRTA
jgi:hypothetical protein